MDSDKGTKPNMIAKALGASEVISIKGSRPRGPLEWLQFTQALQSRLVSRGGRPSNPHWDLKRLVPFRRRTWKHLAKEAEAISAQGRKVGPAQLVAMIIEDSVVTKEGFIFNKQAHFLSPSFEVLILKSPTTKSQEGKTAERITLDKPFVPSNSDVTMGNHLAKENFQPMHGVMNNFCTV